MSRDPAMHASKLTYQMLKGIITKDRGRDHPTIDHMSRSDRKSHSICRRET